jgi:hypothetical protein
VRNSRPLPAWDFNPPGSINGQGLNPGYGKNIYLRQAVPLVQITFMTSPQGLGGSVVAVEAFDSSRETAGNYQTTTVGVPEVFEFTGDIQRIEIRGTRHEASLQLVCFSNESPVTALTANSSAQMVVPWPQAQGAQPGTTSRGPLRDTLAAAIARAKQLDLGNVRPIAEAQVRMRNTAQSATANKVINIVCEGDDLHVYVGIEDDEAGQFIYEGDTVFEGGCVPGSDTGPEGEIVITI